MVDTVLLANDILSTVVSVAITPALWLAVFLWAWTRPDAARDSGIGRMAFWLLLPGAFLGSLANAPFFGWAGNVLAINVGGALVPILLSLVLLRRTLGDGRWAPVGTFLAFLVAETAAQFLLVVRFPNSPFLGPMVAGVAGGTILTSALFVFLSARARTPGAKVPSGLVTCVGLTSFVTVSTFLGSQAVPGLGIVEPFPWFLLPPIAVGALSLFVARYVGGRQVLGGLPVAYATTTFGPVLGADVLRQPPLYGSGPPALLSIGGAGVLDLVYLSGLLALGTGIVIYTAFYRPPAPVIAAQPVSTTHPEELLRSAVGRAERGEPGLALREAVDAATEAAGRARAVWQIPPPGDPAGAWDPIPVQPYVRSDYRNLRAQLAVPPAGPRELRRSLYTANFLVRLGRDLSRLRFASVGRRAWAFLIDLALVTAPAVALWVFLASSLPGGASGILGGLPFNTAAFGFVAYAFLYFVALDRMFGATVGKRLLHVSVTDRRLARPTLLQATLRETPKLIPLFALGDAGASAIVLLLNPTLGPVAPVGVDLAVFTAIALLLLGGLVTAGALGFGALLIGRGAERQRLGDRWAATWVVDRRVSVPPPGARLSPPALATGPDPSA